MDTHCAFCGLPVRNDALTCPHCSHPTGIAQPDDTPGLVYGKIVYPLPAFPSSYPAREPPMTLGRWDTITASYCLWLLPW